MKHTILQNQCSHAVRLCTAMCLGMMAVAVCFAQTEVVSFTKFDKPIQKTLIRSYKYPNVISYVETATRHAFIYTDMQTFHQIGEIKPAFEVNDYALWNDTVYFCGKTTIGTTSYGILGYFRCGEMFGGPHCYYIQTFLPTNSTGGYVENLSHIICYRDSLKVLHVVAIGTESAYRNSCIVEYQPNSTTPVNYFIGIADKNSFPFAEFRDITCTDDYLVVLESFETPPHGNISLRLFHKTNLFASGGMQDSSHTYTNHYWSTKYFTQNMHIVNIENNLVATAVYEKDTTSPYLYDGTQLSLFDIHDVRHYLPYGMIFNSEISQTYASIGNWKLLELRNDPSNQTLLLLQQTEHSAYPSQYVNVVNEISYAPGPIPTIIPGYLLPNIRLQSMDITGAKYAANGYSVTTPNNMYYLQRVPLSGNRCSSPLTFPYKIIDTGYQKIEHSPLQTYKTFLKFTQCENKLSNTQIVIECVE